MPKVLVCVPTYENITPDTFKALWDMDKPCQTDFEFVRGYDVAAARNRCAKLALESDYTHLMMVDNDVTPCKDALVNLLSDNVDVVTGYYAHRNKSKPWDGRTCVCKTHTADGKPYFDYPPDSQYTSEQIGTLEGLTEVHGGGMGLVLINVRVFFGMKRPYFDWVEYYTGGSLSEDLYFCEQLHANDIPIYLDPRVRGGHLFRYIQE